MKKISTILFALLISATAFSQQAGYYNGTEGKSGEELKTSLNGIISGHTPYSYYFAKEIFKISDADPENADNVIQVYTGFSHDNSDYGTSGLELNREHVWAKSHGGFADMPPMYGDVHNLKPAAATVNQSKSNLDFDNGGVQHAVATECYYTDSTWEARDEVKGDIARIIFYMATRYEGNDGEMDLEVVDHNHTYPLAQHGKLSTLLQWNLLDPPDAFERNRNDVIFTFQKNRNPFIDDPNFAELIWGNATASAIQIGNIEINPQLAVAEEPVTVSANIVSSTEPVSSTTLYWGLSFEALDNEVEMSADGDVFSAQIPGQAEDATVYYKITATNVETTNSSVVYNYYVPKIFTGTIVSIYDIQGQQDDSPYDGEIVSTTGVVTGNFGSNYFIQDGTGGWNGLFIYESGRNPSIGDSIVLTGEIAEYYGKTELIEISDYYFISGNNALPEPVIVTTGGVEEQHESILVTVKNAMCTDDNYQADHFMWKIDDGSGVLKVHNTSVFEYDPTEGNSYNVTGPMNYDFDEWKIELRFESDVAGGSDEEGPTVVEVTPIVSTNVKVMFNEAVETTTAEDVANYSINNGIIIEGISQHFANKAQVNLTVSELSGDYEITIQNIKDLSGNVMQEQSMTFSFVGIEDIFLNGEVKVFPNPASQQVNISFNALENIDLEIQLADVSGRIVKHVNYAARQGENSFSFDLDNVSKGMYFLNIQGNNSSLRYKIVVR